MATKSRAILNDLNARARQYGAVGVLSMRDLDSIREYYPACCKCQTTDNLTIDHVTPLELSGANAIENLQSLCESCNKAKAATYADYRPQDKPILTHKQKHNWIEIESEFVTTDISTRDLAQKHNVPYPTLRDYAISHDWQEQREHVRSKVVAGVKRDMERSRIGKELSARGLLFDVIETAIDEWKTKPKASARDLAELLKLGLAAQGETTERTNLNVSERVDDAEIHARINRLFDTGEEDRTYSPIGPGGEEPGTGWADSLQ